MKNIVTQSVRIVFLFILSLHSYLPALAHSGEPRLEISVDRLNPGGTVEVRGVDFDYEELVTLSLASAAVKIPLNEVTADVEGTFTKIVILPVDLSAGEYHFLATTDHEVVASPTLTVWGVAAESQGGDVIQDQSDVQFEPIATASAPLPQAAASGTPPTTQRSATPIYFILAGIGIISFLALRILQNHAR